MAENVCGRGAHADKERLAEDTFVDSVRHLCRGVTVVASTA